MDLSGEALSWILVNLTVASKRMNATC